MNKFGETIRQRREEQGILLRHVAAQLDIDTAMLSKVERGERKTKREHVVALSKILDLDSNKLLTLWLADRIFEVIEEEESPSSALSMVLNEISKANKP